MRRRRHWPRALLACLAGATGLPAATGAMANEPPLPAATPQAGSARVHEPFWGQRLTGYLTARDGTRLRYSVLLPQGEGSFPTIVNYSGYDPGAIGGDAYLHDDTAMSVNLDRTLVEQGYAVFGVSARGTGCSEGVFDFLGADYGRDGFDAVEFIAVQPWSNGAVGMANWSWAGMSQLVTAGERPPHLKAIAPGMVLGDARLDSWAPGGVPAPAFVAGWWDYLHSRWNSVEASARAEGDDQCLAQLEENRRTAELNNLSTMIIRHPLRDAYIEQRHLAARTDRIEVPVLSMTSFQDEAVTSRDGHYQETLDPERLWLVQTNGGHDLYESTRFREILVSFFDRFVKGRENGFEQRPHLEIWMESSSHGEGHAYQEAVQPRYVLSSPSYPVNVEPIAFYLRPGGSLGREPAAPDQQDSYRYPVPGPAVNTQWNNDMWGDQPAGWREGSLAYTSPVLETDLVAYGPGSADLWLSSTATDADLQVTLTEIRPDGQEMFVQRGWLRLSNRALDAGRSNALRPVLLDRPETMEALTPGVPVLARVELPKFAHAFREGSRLRLWIDTPSAWGGYGFSPNALPARNLVWRDTRYPSRIVLGKWPDLEIPDQVPACGTVLKQPCRSDPLVQPER